MAYSILADTRALATSETEITIDPKLWFDPTTKEHPCKPRKNSPEMVVLHWTGAENPVETFYANCLQRKVSAHFFIGGSGRVHQLADVEDTVCYHAKSPGGVVNARSIGIEIQNIGLASKILPASKTAHSTARPTYIDVIKGKKLSMAMFNLAQLDALADILNTLADAKFIQRCVPRTPVRAGDHFDPANDWSDYVSILREPMSMAALKKFRGVCGHYHVPENTKYDPGTQPFQMLLDEGWDH
jgi:N-acetyl-anhydromuramyl-L-alanine amidase AmpD